MTRDEKSLLLFLETQAVDYAGKVASEHMNAADFVTARAWNAAGFLQFGRIPAGGLGDDRTYWVILSDAAWEEAAKERRERAGRICAVQTYAEAKEGKDG